MTAYHARTDESCSQFVAVDSKRDEPSGTRHTLREAGLDLYEVSDTQAKRRPWLRDNHFSSWPIDAVRDVVAEFLGIPSSGGTYQLAAAINAECRRRGLVEPHLYLHRRSSGMQAQLAACLAAMDWPIRPLAAYPPPMALPPEQPRKHRHLVAQTSRPAPLLPSTVIVKDVEHLRAEVRKIVAPLVDRAWKDGVIAGLVVALWIAAFAFFVWVVAR